MQENFNLFFSETEGSGAGGRAIIFRSSNFNAVSKFANSKAKLKHGSALGNDIFKYQLIKRYNSHQTTKKDLKTDILIVILIILSLQRTVFPVLILLSTHLVLTIIPTVMI